MPISSLTNAVKNFGIPTLPKVPTLSSNYYSKSNTAPVTQTLSAAKVVQPTQATQPTLSADQQIANSIANQIKTWSKFTDVLPYNTIVNEDLLRQFGESQGNPEANRLKWTSLYNNLVNQSRAGTLYSGGAQAERYNLGNQLERQRQELINQFYQAGKTNLGNYYNTLMNEYYRDPNAFQYNPVSLADVMAKGY